MKPLMNRKWQSCLHALVKLWRNRAAVVAVEFALIAPVMITIYFGAPVISAGFAANRKISLVTSTVGSLVSKQSAITTSQMSDYLSASTAIMAPFSAAGIKITVSCLDLSSGKATVSWSATLNGTARTVGSFVTVPAAVNNQAKLLFSEVTYPYTPVVRYYVKGSVTMSRSIYTTPRITSAPIYNGTAC